MPPEQIFEMCTIIDERSDTSAAETEACGQANSHVRFAAAVRDAAVSGTVSRIWSWIQAHHDFAYAHAVPLGLRSSFDLEVWQAQMIPTLVQQLHDTFAHLQC